MTFILDNTWEETNEKDLYESGNLRKEERMDAWNTSSSILLNSSKQAQAPHDANPLKN